METNYLEWDSDFFKKKISKIVLPLHFEEGVITNLLLKQESDLYYIFAKSQQTFLLSMGAKLMDEKVVFQKNVTTKNEASSFITSYKGEATDALLDLAYLSGQHSRFRHDKIIGEKFKELYSLWLRKSLSREIADEVFVYTEDNSIEGFVSLKQHAHTCVIGLIAVNEKKQGKKIGGKLLNAVNNWCLAKEIKTIEVATQKENTQACGFYASAGYTIKSTDHIYHYHKH